MRSDNLYRVVEVVKSHEGLSLKPYYCTAGKLSIGYGRNLEDNGITQQEAEQMLMQDLNLAMQDVYRVLPDVPRYPEQVQTVLIDMMFNLGMSRFKTFKRFITAIEAGDYSKAIEEMRDSKWYTQVPNRVESDIKILQELLM